jgi:heme O synthase-like polyprenyltransferase
MSTVKNYLSLIRFSHTIFAMPFAMIGFFLGLGVYQLSWHAMSGPEIVGKLVLVILCMIFARSAAMAFNRWLDVKWDALNPRTAIREIPKGDYFEKQRPAFCHRQQPCLYHLHLVYQSAVFRVVVCGPGGSTGVQLYQTVYSLMPPGAGPGSLAGADRRLSGRHGSFCAAANSVLPYCHFLGQRLRYYLCPAG